MMNVNVPKERGNPRLSTKGKHETGVVPRPALVETAMPSDMIKRPRIITVIRITVSCFMMHGS